MLGEERGRRERGEKYWETENNYPTWKVQRHWRFLPLTEVRFVGG
jgi:hypothetical protein